MKNIADALLKVQQSLDPVYKGRKGYGYNYADLPAVMDSCLEALNNAGVLVVQAPSVTEKQAAAIFTRLIHAETAEEITSLIEVPWAVGGTKMSEAQAYGSAMTYARRYALVSMLGIVTEDDDGAGAGRRDKPQEQIKAPLTAPSSQEKASRQRAEAKVAKIRTELATLDTFQQVQWIQDNPAQVTALQWIKRNYPDLYAEIVGLGVEV